MHLELAIRILVGTFLGGIIGYERDLHGRPAGLRTHTLVALASATFMVVSTRFAYWQGYSPGDGIEVDGSRIAASVVTGIGFLAGGTILRTGVNVQGLTTAAGLWLVAAIGLAAGAGMFVESALATTIGVGALTLLRRFEDKDDRTMLRRTLSVTLRADGAGLAELHARLAHLGAHVVPRVHELDVAAGTRAIQLDLRLPATVELAQVANALQDLPDLVRARLEPMP